MHSFVTRSCTESSCLFSVEPDPCTMFGVDHMDHACFTSDTLASGKLGIELVEGFSSLMIGCPSWSLVMF